MPDTEFTEHASDPVVQYRVEDGAATLTLDSQHNRNAISAAMVDQLRGGLDAAARDPGVRAVVLTHRGGTFCAGADLGEASGDPGEAAAQRTHDMVGLLRGILELPKPVIGVIDGHVRAGGMGLIGACDMVVAGPRATFALTEARLGLAASIISLTVLPRMAPRAVGRYFLTGERFGPQEAVEHGLVTLVAEDPAARVAGLIADLRECSPQGLAESKHLLTMRILDDFDRYAEGLAAQSARLFGSPEAAEGVAAFLQRRPPSWSPGR